MGKQGLALPKILDMRLSECSIRTTDYLHAQSLFTFSLSLSHSLSLPLSLPLFSLFQLNTMTVGVSLFQLNLSYHATTSMSQSSRCCQSLKLFLSLLLSVVISVKLMQPSSTPFTSSPHHSQRPGVLPLSSSEVPLRITSIQIFSIALHSFATTSV